VGAELGRELARRLGVEPAIIEYPSPGAAIDAVGTGWDVAFVAADPERETATAFTPPYVEIETTYLVRNGSRIQRVADADTAGVKIATGVTSGYTFVLRRQIRSAELVLLNNEDALEALQAGAVDAMAGLRFGLEQFARRVPGSRVLPDNFTLVRQAIAVPRANTEALTYVTEFVRDVVRSGLAADAIRRTGLPGARVP
jgi:polar amino acid transport system substrate-binding protein